MKSFLIPLVVAALSAHAAETAPVPQWAYYFPDAKQPPVVATNGLPQSVPGSTRTYTLAQIDDLKNPPDWFPNAHDPMPAVVAKGGEGMTFACASCHLTSGMGHPQSAPLAGLPVTYFERQIHDYQSGRRRNPITVDGAPQVNAVQYMVMIAHGMSDAEVRSASTWFAKLKPVPWVKVVETPRVPKTYITPGFSRAILQDGGEEPIGNRIIELPQSVEGAAARDPRVGTIAYVPPGAIDKGRLLATTGAGRTIQCHACHGAQLTGLGDIPGIAGISPTYAFRQLYGFKTGSRSGAQAAAMTGVVTSLSEADMIAISAYAATLPN